MRSRTAFATLMIVWMVVMFAVLAFWGTVGYVALHFISKFW